MSPTSPITTHILDTANGHPAAGVSVSLEYLSSNETWEVVGTGTTDDDGRIGDLLEPGSLAAGRYRIRFDTGGYFAATGTASFYPEVLVTFEIQDDRQHYHVPLLLNPFGYSTYRGS